MDLTVEANYKRPSDFRVYVDSNLGEMVEHLRTCGFDAKVTDSRWRPEAIVVSTQANIC